MRLIANAIQNDEPARGTISDQVVECCRIAREKLEVGDYDAGCAVLQRWWKIGQWQPSDACETVPDDRGFDLQLARIRDMGEDIAATTPVSSGRAPVR